MTLNQQFNTASKQAGIYEDLITNCEDKADLEYLKKEFKAWTEKADMFLNQLLKKLNK